MVSLVGEIEVPPRSLQPLVLAVINVPTEIVPMVRQAALLAEEHDLRIQLVLGPGLYSSALLFDTGATHAPLMVQASRDLVRDSVDSLPDSTRSRVASVEHGSVSAGALQRMAATSGASHVLLPSTLAAMAAQLRAASNGADSSVPIVVLTSERPWARLRRFFGPSVVGVRRPGDR